jgi:hypothetical protein
VLVVSAGIALCLFVVWFVLIADGPPLPVPGGNG